MYEVREKERIGLAFEQAGFDAQVRHVFSTRARDGGGNLSLSGGRDRAAALAERHFWSERIGADPADWVVGSQVHRAGVRVVGDAERGRGALDPATTLPETDGLVTSVRGLPLYVAVADCAAVMVLAPGDRPVLGVAHAGWRGLQAGVLARVVAETCALAGAAPGGCVAGVSPCIGLAHFEVGEEVLAAAPERRRVRLGARWHVDLAGWANDQLLGAGLVQGRVEFSGLDTFERADLCFSHRRDGASAGRMGLIAMLAPAPEAASPPRA
ncbi:MAG TPA: polyphenol oxidase family protein [Planctomycetota bacterium]